VPLSLATLALATALAPVALDAPSSALDNAVERTTFLMGTRLELTVEGQSRAAALAASEAAVEALERTEARLSTWRDDTELARLNRSPAGEPFVASTELHDELRDAIACSELTAGAFDPSVGPLVRAWGLRDGGRRPTPAELSTSLAAVGLDGLELRPGHVIVRRRANFLLEEGAFGKGAGLDRAIERIAATPGTTSALLDFGGQVAVWRAPQVATSATPVEIAVADPVHRDVGVLALAIESGSLSTSGSSERGIVVDGEHLSHELDPHTGLPANDLGSVTVWAPTALLADCLSTGLYVLGVDGIERWTASHPEIGVLVLPPASVDGAPRTVLASAALAGRVEPLAPGLTVKWIGGGAPAIETSNEALSPSGGSH
jgi:thiamine biosynthesis lipoprotein